MKKITIVSAVLALLGVALFGFAYFRASSAPTSMEALERLFAAQCQARRESYRDSDSDGVGEYLFLDELIDWALGRSEYQVLRELRPASNGKFHYRGWAYAVALPKARGWRGELIIRKKEDNSGVGVHDGSAMTEQELFLYVIALDDRNGDGAYVVDAFGEVWKAQGTFDDIICVLQESHSKGSRKLPWSSFMRYDTGWRDSIPVMAE